MAKKKAARPARKAGPSAKRANRKASAPARRTAKAAKKARKAAKSRPAARKRAAKPARRSAARKAARPKKAASARRPKAASARRSSARKPVRKSAKSAKSAPAKAAAKSPTIAPVKAAAPRPAPKPAKKPNLDRPRRTVAEIHGVPSSLDLERPASAVRTGRAEMEQKLQQHTNTSPALTAGDVDADWGAAESSGDEAPGGDNPTPDQDVVDEIGRALGVEYDDDEELQGGDEIAKRDRHRWELDPGSSDDFEER